MDPPTWATQLAACGNRMSSHGTSEGPGWGACGQGTVWPDGNQESRPHGGEGERAVAGELGFVSRFCFRSLVMDRRPPKGLRTQCADARPGRSARRLAPASSSCVRV